MESCTSFLLRIVFFLFFPQSINVLFFESCLFPNFLSAFLSLPSLPLSSIPENTNLKIIVSFTQWSFLSTPQGKAAGHGKQSKPQDKDSEQSPLDKQHLSQRLLHCLPQGDLCFQTPSKCAVFHLLVVSRFALLAR